MSEHPIPNWIGALLRSTYLTTLDAPFPDGFDELLSKIDGELSLRTFAHDLTALVPRLRAYARSLTREADAADDLVQDALLRAWKHRDQFVSGTSLRAWTSTILRNLFLSQRRRARFSGDYDEQAAEIRLARPEAQSAVVELDDVRRAMEALGVDQREALRLVSIEGVSYEEGARLVGTSLGSFKSRVWRARKLLQSIIDGDVLERPFVPSAQLSPASSSK